MVRLLLLSALLSTPALSWAGRGAVEHLSGADISDWSLLEQRRPVGEDAIEAYRGFVVRWPDSALAEAAWARLVRLQAAEVEGDTAQERHALARVKARWSERQRTLAWARRDRREPSGVIDLDASASATAFTPRSSSK